MDPKSQLSMVRRFAETCGWTVAREYIDCIETMREPLEAWRAMLAEVPKHHFEGILVARLNVAFRSVKHMHETLHILIAHGISFHSLAEGFDTRSLAGGHTLRVIASIAGFESETRRQRICAGIAQARLKGRHIGRPPITSRPEIRQMWPAVEQRIQSGEISIAEAARILGIGKTTVRRLLTRQEARGQSATSASRPAMKGLPDRW